MSYDISLVDPVTKEPLHCEQPHMIRGGTYAIGGTTELWLNITYNYAHYYYEATDGDPRFAHDKVLCYYEDGSKGPIETEYGIRGIYGKTGAESIPMLRDMIDRITAKYKPDSQNWISTKRKKQRVLDEYGVEHKDAYRLIISGKPYTTEDYEVEVSEGPCKDYWEPTAANAIGPLYKLIALAQLRPDGLWDGD